MSRLTPLLIHPTIDECVKLATSCKPPMPESEGRKFFYHYESNGWKVGKLPMKSVAGAMGGWHERWMERTGGIVPGVPVVSVINGHGKRVGDCSALTGAQIMLKQKELERIMERIKVIRSSYDSHQELRQADREELRRLRERMNVLKKELGVEY